MSQSETTVVVNGDSPHSTTLRHLLTLPVVQDGVRAFQANPLGKMSIQLSNSAYQLVGAPILSLFYKPLSYVSPYAQRVDQFGDQTLSKVEEKYPAVKKPSPELLEEAKKAAYAPVKHLSDVYNVSLQKVTGGPTIATGKAAVRTAVVVGVEGSIIAIREAIKFTEGLPMHDSLKSALKQLEETFDRQNNTGSSEQNGSGAKTSST